VWICCFLLWICVVATCSVDLLQAAFLAASRVDRVNPNPKYRVPEMSGFVYFKQISGWSF